MSQIRLLDHLVANFEYQVKVPLGKKSLATLIDEVGLIRDFKSLLNKMERNRINKMDALTIHFPDHEMSILGNSFLMKREQRLRRSINLKKLEKHHKPQSFKYQAPGFVTNTYYDYLVFTKIEKDDG